MQEKPFYVHVELHKEIVKNAWIISHEGRKILVIEFQDTVTEDESITYALWECPVCGATDQHGHNYCDQCGQRLGWEDQI